MKKKFVLIVEDNPDDQLLIKRVFKKYNIANDMIFASDGAEAVDLLFSDEYSLLTTYGEYPALIILDLKLPKVSGLEILDMIRSNVRTKLIPVVIMTSSKEEQDILNGYNLGANSYIRKPIIFEEFAEAVRQIGMYWFLLNEPLP